MIPDRTGAPLPELLSYLNILYLYPSMPQHLARAARFLPWSARGLYLCLATLYSAQNALFQSSRTSPLDSCNSRPGGTYSMNSPSQSSLSVIPSSLSKPLQSQGFLAAPVVPSMIRSRSLHFMTALECSLGVQVHVMAIPEVAVKHVPAESEQELVPKASAHQFQCSISMLSSTENSLSRMPANSS